MQNPNIKKLSQFVLDYASSQKREVTNFNLQRILYLLWIEFLKQHQQPLFYDYFRAWQIGPCIPDVYYEYCSYGAMPINNPLTSHDTELQAEFTELIPLLEQIFKLSPEEMKEKICKPGLAWDKIYNNGEGKEKRIPFSDIINLDIQNKPAIEKSKQANPYEKINQQLKEDSEKIFHSTDINEQDVKDLKNAMETAKVILTRIEPNETTDFIQSFLNFVIKMCG